MVTLANPLQDRKSKQLYVLPNSTGLRRLAIVDLTRTVANAFSSAGKAFYDTSVSDCVETIVLRRSTVPLANNAEFFQIEAQLKFKRGIKSQAKDAARKAFNAKWAEDNIGYQEDQHIAAVKDRTTESVYKDHPEFQRLKDLHHYISVTAKETFVAEYRLQTGDPNADFELKVVHPNGILEIAFAGECASGDCGFLKMENSPKKLAGIINGNLIEIGAQARVSAIIIVPSEKGGASFITKTRFFAQP